MEDVMIRKAERAAFWGRLVGVALGVPIYLSLLTTFPAVAAVFLMVLYFGVPIAVRHTVIDPMRHPAGST